MEALTGATACLIRLSQHLRVNAFVFRPNGMAVRMTLVLGVTIMRSFVRVGVVECAVAVTQRQPACANATNQRTSIPFGHHAIPKTLAVADSLALSE
jgi:hypothetical protein